MTARPLPLVLVILFALCAAAVAFLLRDDRDASTSARPVALEQPRSPQAGSAALEQAPETTRPRTAAVASIATEVPPSATDEGDERSQEQPFDPDALYGVVVERGSGRPLSGARIAFLQNLSPGTRPDAVSTTDEAGRFRLPALGTSQTRRLLVEHPGHVPVRTRARPTGVAHRIQLDPAVSLEGRVLWRADRTPVVGAAVGCNGLETLVDGRLAHPVARTNDEGSYRLEGLAPETNSYLSIEPAGGLPRGVRVPNLPKAGTNAQPFEILLNPSSELRLRLVALETGAPLAHLRGRVRDGATFETDGRGELSLTYDRLDPTHDGSFVYLDIPGACSTLVDLSTEDRAKMPEVARDVPVARGGRVAGRVVDADGAPVQGAKVLFRSVFVQQTEGLLRGVDFEPPRKHYETHSDADGRFVLEDLLQDPPAAGTVLDDEPLLLAFHPDFLTAELPFTPQPNATATLEVVLQRGARLEGLVFAGTEPLAGVKLEARAGGKARAYTAYTDERGHYAFPSLPAGMVELRVREAYRNDIRLSLGPDHRADLLVQLDAVTTHDVELPEILRVTGVVVDGEGTPCSDALVFVHEKGKLTISSTGSVAGLGSIRTRSDDDGRFTLCWNDRAPPVEVVARREGVASTVAWNGEEGDLRLVLPDPAEVRLHPVTERGNEPLVALATWRPSGSPRATTPSKVAFSLPTSLEDGAFHLPTGVGRFDVELDVEGYRRVELRDLAAGDGPVDVPLRPGCRLVLTFEGLPEESHWGTIRMVREDAGEPLQIDGGMPFAILDKKHNVRPGSTPWVGHGLEPGPYRLKVPETWIFEPSRFEVPDALEHEIRIRCRRVETDTPTSGR